MDNQLAAYARPIRLAFALSLLSLVAAGPPTPAPTPKPPTPITAPLPTPESVGLSTQGLTQAMAVLNAGVAEGRIAGAVFAVSRHGKLAWLQAVGFRDGTLRDRMTPDAIFPLASMTKPIASVAAMILVERGKIMLSDPLSRYIPAFREMQVAVQTKDPDTGVVTAAMERARRPITIQDLLRHTAGMVNGRLAPTSFIGRQYIQSGMYNPDQTLEASIDKLAKLPLAHQPGSKFDYSQATDVLARVVEIASGQSFAEFVATQITAPLKMVDTAFVAPGAAINRLTSPRPDPLTGALPGVQDMLKLPKRIGGNAGLVGTASDYIRFGHMLLGSGTLDGVRILGAGTIAHMTEDHLGAIPHDSPSGIYLLGPGRGFGLGLSVRMSAENAMPGSTGDFDWGGAFGTQFLVDPKQELVAVLMINQQNQFDRYFRLFRTLVYASLVK